MSARPECAWCGADKPAEHTKRRGWCRNREGEEFCCPSHRDQSNEARRRFLGEFAP